MPAPAPILIAALLAAPAVALLRVEDTTLLRSGTGPVTLAVATVMAVLLLRFPPRSPLLRAALPPIVALAWWRTMPLHNWPLTLVLAIAVVAAARAWWRPAWPLWLALAALVAAIGWLRTGTGLDSYLAAVIDGHERRTATCLFRDSTPADCIRPPVAPDAPPPAPQDAWLAARLPGWVQLAQAVIAGSGSAPLRLGGRDLRGAVAREATLVGADFAGARLDGADFAGADLAGARLARAVLPGARLDVAGLERADLVAADLRGASLLGARLQGATLDGADLRGASLWSAKLDEARLRDVRLGDADLRAARLAGADLDGADLRHVSLRGAGMVGASLAGARLDGALMLAADLREADWAGATGAAVLHGADLRGARGLTQAQLDAAVGDADTLLPDRPAPDTGRPFAVPGCWAIPPPEAERMVDGVATALALDADPAAVRSDLLCGERPPQPTGTPLALEAERPPGHPLAGRD